MSSFGRRWSASSWTSTNDPQTDAGDENEGSFTRRAARLLFGFGPSIRLCSFAGAADAAEGRPAAIRTGSRTARTACATGTSIILNGASCASRRREKEALCRTTITGTWATGQMAIRLDLIEREGASRLQILLPVGLYLQAGVKLRLDTTSGEIRLPYSWCFSNVCVAAAPIDRKGIQGRSERRGLFQSRSWTPTCSRLRRRFRQINSRPPIAAHQLRFLSRSSRSSKYRRSSTNAGASPGLEWSKPEKFEWSTAENAGSNRGTAPQSSNPNIFRCYHSVTDFGRCLCPSIECPS